MIFLSSMARLLSHNSIIQHRDDPVRGVSAHHRLLLPRLPHLQMRANTPQKQKGFEI